MRMLDIEAGWLRTVRHRPSPNFNARPPGVRPDLLIIHGISLPPGAFGGDAIERLFLNALDHSAHPYFAGLRGLRVSSHFLVRRDGDTCQYVSCDERAWHAGQSSYAGRADCNDYSIGIELEGTDTLAYTDPQYQALAGIARVLQQAYPGISPARSVGHSEVSPGRKTDPGPAFDWVKFRRLWAQAGV